MTKQLTDTEIQLRVAAKRLGWPESGTTIAWSRLHDCVNALHGLVRVVDDNCRQAEQDQDLSPEGIARRRTELGRQALTELSQFKPFQTADRAVTGDIDLIRKRMTRLPHSPLSIAEVMLAQEIRQFVADQQSPIDFVMKALSDQRVLGAVLTAPSFLSGLHDTEWNLVRDRAHQALHPEQIAMEKHLNGALRELREGVAATRRMLLERCEMSEDEDGQFRSIREPLPGGALGAAKAAKHSEQAAPPTPG